MTQGLQRIYTEVAGTYERVNHVLTFGLDRHWRARAVASAVEGGGRDWLDICSGTGEMAEGLRRRAGADVRIVATDFSPPMLALARRKPTLDGVGLVGADSGRLPFADATFDLVTISFATRNLNPNRGRLLLHLREVRRVLRPGGRFVQLETSQPRPRVLRRLMHFYVAAAVQPVGYLLSGSRSGYAFLAATIPRFYDAASFSALLREAGFGSVTVRLLLGGVAAIHLAQRG